MRKIATLVEKYGPQAIEQVQRIAEQQLQNMGQEGDKKTT